MNTLEQIKDLSSEFLGKLSIEFSSLNVTDDSGKIWINMVPHGDTSLLIGYRGNNLLALQHLIKSFLWFRGIERDLFLLFDIDGYKKKNEEKVLIIAKEKALMVLQTGIPQIMPFLAAGDRRTVHLEISRDFPDIHTESFTDESGKRVLRMKKKENE